MTTTNYTVLGMTCDHCVLSVTEEMLALPGVETALVDLSSGTMTLGTSQPVSDAAVQTAVEDAGYRLA